MYHLCLVGHKHFFDPSKFHMWHFKPFSMARTPLEQEERKVLLEHWFQDLKIKTARWRVPQNIQRCLPPIAHIQLELDRDSSMEKARVDSEGKATRLLPNSQGDLHRAG